MSAEKVLVSWVSFNNDPYERERDGSYRGSAEKRTPGPTLELLASPHSPYLGQVSHAYFLVRRSLRDDGTPRLHDGTEAGVYEKLNRELSTHPSTRRLVIKALFWDTNYPPTAHRPIFEFTVQQLREIRRQHPKATLVINLSPGTPQMQTVMLLAVQARFAGESVEIVQGIPSQRRAAPLPGSAAVKILDQVPWNLLGELNAAETASDGTTPTTVWSIDRACSAPLRAVAADIERLGRLSYPVLILGARGTGKTRIAERLRARFLEQRNRGGRNNTWDFRLNCAALKGPLLESELFGHARGAFTGAQQDKAGLLELAAEDCVFLDEIHHLNADTQARLLVALERRGRFSRVGDTKSREASFRLIAASNRSRDELREVLAPDFYDRVADFIVEVPNLRQCPSDLNEIWRHVASETCMELATSLGLGERQADAFLTAIRRHDEIIERHLRKMVLPGNWRDLQRLARRLVARGLSNGAMPDFSLEADATQHALDNLTREESPSGDMAGEAASLAQRLPSQGLCLAAAHEASRAGRAIPLKELMEELERRLLAGAKQVGGNGRRAAELVGLPVRTFNERHRVLCGDSLASARSDSTTKGPRSVT